VKYRGALLFGVGFLGAMALGWFVFPALLYRTEPQPMGFSHIAHTGEQLGMSCEDCHSFTDEGRFAGIPGVAKCAECHEVTLGETETERILVEEYVAHNREIPWKVYSRQPDNAFFPHAVHVKTAEIECATCHGPHGTSATLPVYQVNRISGYSRDIWGRNISGISSNSWEGMKMDRCVRCHAQYGRRDGCIDCHK